MGSNYCRSLVLVKGNKAVDQTVPNSVCFFLSFCDGFLRWLSLVFTFNRVSFHRTIHNCLNGLWYKDMLITFQEQKEKTKRRQKKSALTQNSQ